MLLYHDIRITRIVMIPNVVIMIFGNGKNDDDDDDVVLNSIKVGGTLAWATGRETGT
jgi:hypothetical protein